MKISKLGTSIFIASIFLYSFVSWLIFVYLPLYLKDLGFSDPDIGILVAIFPFMTLTTQIPFGFLLDRVSPKLIIQLGIVLIGFHLVILLLMNGFWSIFISCAAGGAGTSIFLNSIYSLYYRHLDEKHRGKKIGTFLIGSYGGFAFGPYIGGVLQRSGSVMPAFLLSFVITAVLLVLSIFITDKESVEFSLREYKEDMRQKGVWFLIFIIVIIGVHFGAERVTYSLFLEENVGLSRYDIGVNYLIVGIFLGFFTMLCGYVFDKKKETLLLLSAGLAISGIFHIATVFSRNLMDVVIYRLIHTAGDGFIILATNVLVANAFPDHRMGGNYGIVRTLQTAGIAMSAYACGYLSQWFGYASTFYVSGVLMAGAGLLVVFEKKRIGWMIEKKSG